jgi:hypothetical protein
MKASLFIISLLIGIQLFSQSNIDPIAHDPQLFTGDPSTTGLNYQHYLQSTNYLSRIDLIETKGTSFQNDISYAFRKKNGNSGFGLHYTRHDKVLTRNFKIGLSYAYHYKLKEAGTISAGVRVDYLTFFAHPGRLETIYEDNNYYLQYAILGTYDLYFSGGVSYLSENIYSSIYFSSQDRHALVFGEPDWTIDYGVDLILKSSFYYTFRKDKDLTIRTGVILNNKFPEYMINDDKEEMQTSFGADINFKYKEKYWIGFRADYQYYFQAGTEIKNKFRLGYLMTNSYSVFQKEPNNLFHGLMLAFKI